ncbi:MAG: hypothetical protein FK730_05800 [Asgard group archaeon]|nr:hypothetical protein [Asgard group archaeon]
MNKTQIWLSNSTSVLHPMYVINNESVSIEFPIEIEMFEKLNITCVFNSYFTISSSYTLSIYYNFGKVVEAEIIFQ